MLSNLSLPNSTTTALVHPAGKPQRSSGDAFLRFELCPQTPAVFAMRHVQEAMAIPARRLTPMPNMPPYMLGLMNRRSRVLWVVDLAQMLGLAVLDANVQQYNLVIIQVGTVALGLAVQHIEGITWIEPHQIQSPIGQISSALVPYLRGCALQTQQQKQEILLVLEAESIAQSSLLRTL